MSFPPENSVFPLVTVPVIALQSVETGEFLLSKRLPGKMLAGLYEYPGGKQEPGETPRRALCRELFEELHVTLSPADLTPVGFVDFHFSGSEYLIPMYYAQTETASAFGKEGQEIFYFPAEELQDLPMPPANGELTRVLLRFLRDRIKMRAL